MKSRYWLLALALYTLASLDRPVRAAEAEPTVTLKIESQPLRDALSEFGRQSGLQIVFIQTDVGEALMSSPVAGTYSAHAALDRLLANTSLGYEFINPRTVAIRSKGVEGDEFAKKGAHAPTALVNESGQPLRLAQTENDAKSEPLEGNKKASELASSDEAGSKLEGWIRGPVSRKCGTPFASAPSLRNK